jgi:hypothetical protein
MGSGPDVGSVDGRRSARLIDKLPALELALPGGPMGACRFNQSVPERMIDKYWTIRARTGD